MAHAADAHVCDKAFVNCAGCCWSVCVQVRLPCVQDSSCLASLVEFLYLDDVQQQAALTAGLHLAALQCGLQRLVTRCEAHFAHQLEVQLLSWPGQSDCASVSATWQGKQWIAHVVPACD